MKALTKKKRTIRTVTTTTIRFLCLLGFFSSDRRVELKLRPQKEFLTDPVQLVQPQNNAPPARSRHFLIFNDTNCHNT